MLKTTSLPDVNTFQTRGGIVNFNYNFNENIQRVNTDKSVEKDRNQFESKFRKFNTMWKDRAFAMRANVQWLR